MWPITYWYSIQTIYKEEKEIRLPSLYTMLTIDSFWLHFMANICHKQKGVLLKVNIRKISKKSNVPSQLISFIRKISGSLHSIIFFSFFFSYWNLWEFTFNALLMIFFKFGVRWWVDGAFISFKYLLTLNLKFTVLRPVNWYSQIVEWFTLENYPSKSNPVLTWCLAVHEHGAGLCNIGFDYGTV